MACGLVVRIHRNRCFTVHRLGPVKVCSLLPCSLCCCFLCQPPVNLLELTLHLPATSLLPELCLLQDDIVIRLLGQVSLLPVREVQFVTFGWHASLTQGLREYW